MNKVMFEVKRYFELNHRPSSEVQLIFISRLMMAYGLGRNIALLQTSLYSFDHSLSFKFYADQTEKLATYINL